MFFFCKFYIFFIIYTYLSSLQLQTKCNHFLFLFYIKFNIVKYLFPFTHYYRIYSLFLSTRSTLSTYSMFVLALFMLRLFIADLNILLFTFFSINFIFLLPVLAAAPDNLLACIFLVFHNLLNTFFIIATYNI